jgi:hypothetical protein
MGLFSKKKKIQKYYVVDWSRVQTFDDIKEVLSAYIFRMNEGEKSNELFKKGFLIEKERQMF